MGRLVEASPSQLQRPTDRAKAKLAAIARADVLHGGARALVIVRQVREGDTGSVTSDASKIAKHLDWRECDEVVSSVYTSRSGDGVEYTAYECPECGSVHLGREAALLCCQLDDSTSPQGDDE